MPVSGAGVTALPTDSNNSTVTIHEGSSDPGAAVLSGNVTIPELVKKVIPAVVSIDVKSRGNEDEGTGMIITSNGEVITNNHVIELFTQGGGTGTITVTEYGQTKVNSATLVGYNTHQDVALLKINNPEPESADGHLRQLVQGSRRRRGRGHRQRAGTGRRHAHGDPGHRFRPGPIGHRRR